MISLKGCRVFNYRSFLGIHEVVFNDNGLISITGISNPGESSSGVGKSGFLSVIPFVLGYSSIPATKMQNWFNQDPFWAELELDIDGRNIVIRRGAGKLDLEIDGESIKGGKSLLESKIKELIKIPPEMLEALTYRAQRSRSIFFSKTDGSKKDFLSSILGLNEIDKAIDEAKERVKELGIKIDFVNASLDILSQDRSDLVQPTPYVEPPDRWIGLHFKNEIDHNLPRMVELSSLADLKIEKFKKKLKNDLDLIEQNFAYSLPVGGLEGRLDFEATQKQKELQSVIAKQKQLNKELDKIVQFKKDLVLLITQIDKLNSSLCPTCDRTWVDESSEKKLSFLNSQRQMLEDKISQEHVFQRDLANSFVEESDLKVVLNKLALDIQNYEVKVRVQEVARFSEKSDKINQIKMASMAKIGRIQQTAMALKDEISLLKTQLSNINQKESEIKLNIQKSDLSIDNYNHKLEEVKNRNEDLLFQSFDLKGKIAVQLDFIDLMGKSGFQGAIFQEVLNDISVRITNILRTIPNVSSCTVKFMTTSETEKGTVKNKITPVVFKSGQEITPDSLSGGQLSSLELATDLAVSAVLQDRVGSGPNFLIFDEAFDGLSNLDKEYVLELLKREASNKLILIVDHSLDIKEFFDKTIEIELVEGKNSRIN